MISDEVLVVGNTLPEAREFAKQLTNSTTVRCVTPDNIHLMYGVRVSQIYIVDGVHLDSETRSRLACVYGVSQPQGGATIMDEALAREHARHAKEVGPLYRSIERLSEEVERLQAAIHREREGRHGEREG